MSGGPRSRGDREVPDPWWGALEDAVSRRVHRQPDPAPLAGGVAAAPGRAPQVRRPRRRAGGGIVRQFARGAAQAAVRSQRVRRAAMVLTVASMVGVGLAGSIGVIMLDNVVIRRSAELGRLDTQRKNLRTQNALLAASIAQLSAPPRVVKRAHRLGMTEGPMPRFIFLDPSNRPVRRVREQQVVSAQAAMAPGASAASSATSSVQSVLSGDNVGEG